MPRVLAVFVVFLFSGSVSAQLMVDRYPPGVSAPNIRPAGKVLPALAGNVSLQFQGLDMFYDGGSHGAFFKRDNGLELILFFPHPGYWSAKAKRESKQPVAIQQGRTLVEIAPDSQHQSRLLELLANDIVDGRRGRTATLTLIRIRDCFLCRKPLAEIVKRYDPGTWEPWPD